jgi:hypothetical protein
MLWAPTMFHFERALTWVRRKFLCRHKWLFEERQPELMGLAVIRARCARCGREGHTYELKIIG